MTEEKKLRIRVEMESLITERDTILRQEVLSEIDREVLVAIGNRLYAISDDLKTFLGEDIEY